MLVDTLQPEFEKLHKHLANGHAKSAEYQESLQFVSKTLTKFRRQIGDLRIFNSQGEPIAATQSRIEIDFLEMQLQIYAIQAGTGQSAEALESMTAAYKNVMERNDQHELAQMNELIETLRQSEGIEFLTPAQTRDEAKALAQLNQELEKISTNAALQAFAKKLLPGLDPAAEESWGPGSIRNYLNRFPQRTQRAAVLANGFEKLAKSQADDSLAVTGLNHEAHTIWSELADSPWTSEKEKVAAKAGMERTDPSKVVPLPAESALNTGFHLTHDEAQQLRFDLNEALTNQDLGHLVSDDEAIQPMVIETFDEAEAARLGRSHHRELPNAFIGGAGKVQPLDEPERMPTIPAEKDFETAKEMYTRSKSKVPLKPGTAPTNIKKWAETRERALVQSIFGGATSSKTPHQTLGDYLKKSKFPELSGGKPNEQQIVQLCELTLVRMLRKGTDRQLHDLYAQYLKEPVKGLLKPGGRGSTQSVQGLSPSQQALTSLKNFIEASAKPADLKKMDLDGYLIPQINVKKKR